MKKNLCVLILTFNLGSMYNDYNGSSDSNDSGNQSGNENSDSNDSSTENTDSNESKNYKKSTNKLLPLVCHNFVNKSLIETICELVVKLSPEKIIIYVTKYNIECINKCLKHTNYSKLISYCVLDNTIDAKSKDLNYSECISGNVLVVPGNTPLLKFSSIIKLTDYKFNVKVNDSLFFLYNSSVSTFNSCKDLSPLISKKLETEKSFNLVTSNLANSLILPVIRKSVTNKIKNIKIYPELTQFKLLKLHEHETLSIENKDDYEKAIKLI